MTDTAPQDKEREDVDLPRGEHPTPAHVKAQGQQNANATTGKAESSEDVQRKDI